MWDVKEVDDKRKKRKRKRQREREGEGSRFEPFLALAKRASYVIHANEAVVWQSVRVGKAAR